VPPGEGTGRLGRETVGIDPTRIPVSHVLLDRTSDSQTLSRPRRADLDAGPGRHHRAKRTLESWETESGSSVVTKLPR